MNETLDDGPRPSVVVVGSGPTGLLLAGDLADAGIPVTVVEKRPPGIDNLTRAFAVHARTLEQFDVRGLLDELEPMGRPLERLRVFGRLTLDLGELPSRHRHLLVVPQYEVERALERRAVARGAAFRYETEVTGVRQDRDGVTVDVRDPDGSPGTLRAAYVVGADGLRSTVRGSLGLPFPGHTVIRSVVLADVRLGEDPEALLTVDGSRGAFALLVPFGDGYHRVVCWHRERNEPDGRPVSLAEVREITRLALGRDLGIRDARWMSRFHSDERQAPAYRVGRVFLAGDAAHVHTPAGGQGMNTGLQDAANLSWKLAAVLRGHAAPELLDTYQAERHPVGRAALRSSGAIVRLVTADRPWTRTARAVATAVLSRVGPVRRRVIGQISGIGYRYPAPRGAHPLVGVRVPDVALAGGGRLFEALRGGRFVLVTPDGGATPDRPDEGRLAVTRWAGDRRTTLLVRPDGYVAWAATEAGPREIESALAAHVG